MASLDDILQSKGIAQARWPRPDLQIPQVAETSQISCTCLKLKNSESFRPLMLLIILRILTAGTSSLLEGLEHEDIDKSIHAKGMRDLAQVSYFRIREAMAMAVLHQDEFIVFYNQISLIQQEIQNLLAIVHPHAPGEIEKALIANLSESGVLPASLVPMAHGYLKSSALRAFSSSVQGVEAEKKTSFMNVAIQEGIYYELLLLLRSSEHYFALSRMKWSN